MIATRREVMIGAVAVPALGAIPTAALASAGGTVFVHDPSLETGNRLAAAHSGQVLAIEGDRIRFARKLLQGRPALIVGVSRPADALLIEDVAQEAGYRPVRSDSLEAIMAESGELDRGLVLGWALARSPSSELR